MADRSKIIIRKYAEGDRAQIRKICYDTAYLGDPGVLFFDDDEVLVDILTRYFTDYEPESCFVADDDGRAVGYIIGTLDEKHMSSIFRRNVLFRIFLRVLARGTFFRCKNRRFLFSYCNSLMKGGLSFPDVSEEYPALFHTNIDKRYRGMGLGTQLQDTFMTYLKENVSPGVHCATMSERACRFYKKQGFTVIYQSGISFMKPFTGEILPYYILGKKVY